MIEVNKHMDKTAKHIKDNICINEGHSYMSIRNIDDVFVCNKCGDVIIIELKKENIERG